jgi:hypothetical protein
VIHLSELSALNRVSSGLSWCTHGATLRVWCPVPSQQFISRKNGGGRGFWKEGAGMARCLGHSQALGSNPAILSEALGLLSLFLILFFGTEV